MQLCRYLRWKGYEVRLGHSPEEVAAVLAMNQVPTDCLKTAFPWGPDERPATPECCAPDRPCFVRLWPNRGAS